jgi:hypothetical protein
MATTMDALASFDHLVGNLPLWLLKLDELSTQITGHHTRSMESTYSSEVELVEKAETTEDHIGMLAEATVNAASSEEPQKSHASDVLAIKQACRKRKPGSAPFVAHGPLIVYYDSHIQNAFEWLVRNIATARNNLRRGKTAATLKARMIPLGVGCNSFSAGGRRSMLDPTMTRTAKRTDPNLAADDATTAFDAMDQDLEEAQTTCESAAHQFLRGGDCSEELQVTRDNFQKCFKIAQKEVEKLQEAKARESPETEDTDERKEHITYLDLLTRVEPTKVRPVQFASIGTIEVDDEISDAESVHIDISAIRRMRGRV